MTARVIVTGSRHLLDRRLVWAVLDELWQQHRALVVVHGGCTSGADQLAAEWCRENAHLGVIQKSYAADWDRHGKAAGPIRNGHMIRHGADLVVAFIQPGAANNGTRNCIAQAERARIPVATYTAQEGQ